MSDSSRVGSNTAYLTIKVFVAAVFGLLQMKIFTRYLSLEGMGLLQAMRGLASLMVALFLVGLPNLAMRFIPQLETRGERGRILRFGGALLGGVTLAFVLVALAAWRWRSSLAGRFGLESEILPQVLLLALGMGLTEFLYASYQGLRRMAPVALAELTGIALVTGHLFLWRDGLEPGRALGILAAYFFLRCVLLLILVPRYLPPPRDNVLPLRIARRDFLDYWSMSIVLRWLALAYLDIDRYVIGMVGALDLVALFHVPAKLVGLSRSFLAAPAISLQTEVSRFYEERREGELPARLQLFLRVQLVFTLWLAAALFLLAKPLILLTATSAYLSALPLLLILLLVLPLTSLAAPMEAAFRGMQGLRVILLGNLIWALAYFGALPWMLERWGLVGLGLAQLGAAFLQVAWVMGAAGRRGWLRGLGRPLGQVILYGSSPLLPALILPLVIIGDLSPEFTPTGIVLGLACLVLGACLLLRGHRLFSEAEKGWLLARLPGQRLRRVLGDLLRVRETGA